MREPARDTRVMGLALGALIAAAACSPGGYDQSVPHDGAQGSGGSSLIRSDAGVLVDPAGRYAWVRHDDSLLAVNATSGAITTVQSLDGLSNVRVAFVSSNDAIFLANDPAGCPFATNACTRIMEIDTVAAQPGTSHFEGSTLDFSIQSPSKRFVSLSGGFADMGVFVTSSSHDLRLVQWESLAGGTGWSRCIEGEACEERLWMVGRQGILSWPVIGGVLADQPDVSDAAECLSSYYTYQGGYPSVVPLVASSESGRWVALTCGSTIHLYDAEQHQVRETHYNGPVAFEGELLVGHFYEGGGDGYGYTGTACLEFVDPQSGQSSSVCLPVDQFTYYVAEPGWVIASSYEGLYVVTRSDEYDPDYVHIAGYTLTDGAFVERIGSYEIWFLQNGWLSVLPLFGPEVFPIDVPAGVEALNIFPSQNELALKYGETLVFYSMVTGSSQTIALP